MVKTNYANAYKEVLVILNNLIKEDYDKIPKKYLEFLTENCNNDYEFYYDTSKTFEQQELLDDTKYILFGLFEKFGSTELQKEKIKAFKNTFYRKLEEEKKAKYNPENIFSNQYKNSSIDNVEKNKELVLLKTNNIKWYKKIWRFLTNFFQK